MKSDILTKADIKTVIDVFYKSVKTDEVIGFFFSEIIPVDWEKHSEQMCSFWENVLFFTGDYEGNPIVTHRHINEKYATNLEHFERWIMLFDITIDALYKGPNAEKMKQHSKAIASVMMKKI